MKANPKAKSAVKPRREPAPQLQQLAAAQALAAAMPDNSGKAKDFGRENAVAPARGASTAGDSPTASASTLSEINASLKSGALDRARSDASGQAMATNQGVAIGDNQNSLKAGLRGPTLLEDFILRERLTHFDHERKLGTHSLVWDEAVKISGAASDFHRRDLWDAVESGGYAEWELGLQIFTEAQAEAFSFDVLDATKPIPEELVPVTSAGCVVLNRDPDNFFAETEQVAFCTAHVARGIDFSNDPLLAGRIHSYIDTQSTRLGGWRVVSRIQASSSQPPPRPNAPPGTSSLHRAGTVTPSARPALRRPE